MIFHYMISYCYDLRNLQGIADFFSVFFVYKRDGVVDVAGAAEVLLAQVHRIEMVVVEEEEAPNDTDDALV